MDGFDSFTAFSIAACMLNNIGVAMGAANPDTTFAGLSLFAKWASILFMLLGRLEILPIILFLHPKTWRY